MVTKIFLRRVVDSVLVQKFEQLKEEILEDLVDDVLERINQEQDRMMRLEKNAKKILKQQSIDDNNNET